MRREARARLQRYRMRDSLASLGRFARTWFAGPEARAFVVEALGGTRHVRKETFEFLGYGVYVGRK